MAELVDRDQEHLRLLVIGYYIMAGMLAFFSLFALLYIGLGAMFVFGAIPANGSNDNPDVAGRIFLILGLAMFCVGIISALLTFLAGRGIQARRRRILSVVIAVLCCLQIPWGTALGVCAIIVLNRPSVKSLFESAGAPPETVLPSA